MEVRFPRIFTYTWYTILGFIAMWITLRFLLPWLMPFLVAFGLAALMEPAVRFLSRRLHLPRGLSAAMVGIFFVSCLLFLLIAIFGRAGKELSLLLMRLSDLLPELGVRIQELELQLYRSAETMSGTFSDFLFDAASNLPQQIVGALGNLSKNLVTWLSSMAGTTSSIFSFAATCGIGVYFISAEYPEIKVYLKEQVPPKWENTLSKITCALGTTLGGWARAQFILTALSFGILVIAFTFLHVNYAIILSLIISLVDALPILGAGTILLPWGGICILLGNPVLGIGLILTYAILSLVHNFLQAKLLGKEMGLHPVITLISIYVGYSALGIWGMIFAPIAAMSLKQMYDVGVFGEQPKRSGKKVQTYAEF